MCARFADGYPADRDVKLSHVLACAVFGHRYRFSADGSTTIRRCGDPGGEKQYACRADAEHYARAFDREDREDRRR